MKILYCIASFSGKGGTEKVLSTKIKYLVDMGHEVELLISDQQNKPYAYPIPVSVKVTDLKITSFLSSKIKGISFLLNIKILRKIYDINIKLINPDIVIVLERGYEDFVIPYVAKGVPKIREYHTSRKASIYFENQEPILYKLKAKFTRKFYESQYKKYDRFICLTEKDKPNWQHLNNVVVIPNITELNDVSITDITSRPLRLIAVGSMVQDRKGFSELINIWADIALNYKNWTLHIYGDGPYRKTYEKQVRELDCDSKIFLEGITDNIASKYKDSQIFLMTSKGEGLPMVILEAQQNGLPVVVYDCDSGPSDIIKNNIGGFLIEMGNKEEFKSKLKLLLDDVNLRKTKSIEALANSKNYSADKIIPLWLNLFESLKK